MSDTKVTLPRSRLVLRFSDVEDGSVWFGQLDEDNPGRFLVEPSVVINQRQWEEMGKPREITVAIWPGDRQDLMEREDFPE